MRAKIELVSKTGIALVSSARPEHRRKHYNTDPAQAGYCGCSVVG
ncbi:hypothetical protein [Caballeronia udeis]|nr:hypothetical protein [Caballeronia udeis]